ncbi:hypothetical protein CDD82_2143 [Ophiocordyceps australis]|uniref:Uncharacterized protein n=1 Tax=Ophiocordyceps australis TaxID=1399860 RepID=A0A2C5ZKB6_9HYPO|nr:hypothetical protein CDD82_2143 [Ophiocordyceps australis]
MPSLLTINNQNHVSLISFQLAPSTYLGTVVIVLIFVALILPRISVRLPRLPFATANLPLFVPSFVPSHSQPCRHLQPTVMSHPLDALEDSLQDFPPSPLSLRHSEPPTPEDTMSEHMHARLLLDDDDDESETASVGGFSPPAWRNLGNGDRSRGFWKSAHQVVPSPHRRSYTSPRLYFHDSDEGSDDEETLPSEHDMILEQAIRTRLPQGSLSPYKGTSPSPEAIADGKLQRHVNGKSPTPGHGAVDGAVDGAGVPTNRAPRTDNFIRLALRADIQQTTQPIDSAIDFVQKNYRSLTATWLTLITTLVVAVVSISTAKMLVKPAAPRPAGDLVKVAGLARSFEPLIYFSEPAVAHVRELQSTSIAIWDLGESVRISGMADADTIVQSLDTISETMKKLVLDLTRFHTHVDGDVDAILNVMDWAKMHLNRLNTRPPPSHLSHAYDNLHNLLTDARVLEDASGEPTRLGRLTTAVLGMSNPQREQRLIQKLFDAFISTIEEAITEELEHSVGLFALFDDIDDHFLRLARHVAHESSTQDEFHAELLSGLWARMLGTRAAELRKFERNRAILHDVRRKTVRNKGALVGHHGKLLTLKASLESLRGRLASHLVRGLNSSALNLEDQIRGIAGVRDYLADIRRQQKTKVMETLYSRKVPLPEIDAAPDMS